MERGEFGFTDFSIPDLATAIEEAEPLCVDRFNRLRKADQEQKSAFLESLAAYYESINVLAAGDVEEIRRAAASSDQDEFRKAVASQMDKQKKESVLPSGCGKIGWMFAALPNVRVQAKAATTVADSPEAREAMIKSTVNEMYANGISKEEAYKILAKQQNVQPGTIKKIYLR
jgi:hypothetical protein